MRAIYLQLLLVGFVLMSLSAQTLPTILITGGADVVFSAQKGIAVYENQVAFAYIEGGYLKLALSFDFGSGFGIYEIDIPDVLPVASSISPAVFINADSECEVYFVGLDNITDTTNLYQIKFAGEQIVSHTQVYDCTGDFEVFPLSSETNGGDLYFSILHYTTQPITDFQSFSEKDISELTNDPSHPAAGVSYYSADITYGPIHSNTHIYIGPTMPIFYGAVSTAKHIRVRTSSTTWVGLNQSHNIASIFRGGLTVGDEGEWQYVNGIVCQSQGVDLYKGLEDDAFTIKTRGLRPWGLEDTGLLYRVTLNGSIASIMAAETIYTPHQFAVHYSYPDQMHNNAQQNPWYTIGDTVQVNGVPLINNVLIPEMVWTDFGSISVNNTSLYFPGKLEIKGNVSGRMTIASKKDAYLLGHITYQNTPTGQTPDGYIINSNPPYYNPNQVNPTDYFGLVSEGKIIVKYKYRDIDGTIISAPNAVNSDGNVYLYGAYAALGKANPTLGAHSWRAEGVFTYEYQHPHGSPTDYTGAVYRRRGAGTDTSPFGTPFLLSADTTLTQIALHRFRFPPQPGAWDETYNRWPGSSNTSLNGAYSIVNTAEPYYWQMYDFPPYRADGIPDYIIDGHYLNPVYPESVNQIVYLRGTLWNFGTIAQRRRGFIRRSGYMNIDNPDTQNYWDIANFVFGGAHSPTGYDKNYFYDTRLRNQQPPYFPSLRTGDESFTTFVYDTAQGNTTPIGTFDLTGYTQMMTKAKGDIVVRTLMSRDPSIMGRYFVRYSLNGGQSFTTMGVQFHPLCFEIVDNSVIFIAQGSQQYLDIVSLDLNTLGMATFPTNIAGATAGWESDTYLSYTGNKILFFIDDGISKKIYDITDLSSQVLLATIDFDNVEYPREISLKTAQTDTVYIAIKDIYQNIYLSKVHIAGVTPDTDDVVPSASGINLTCYPNPFNPSTTIKFSIQCPVARNQSLDNASLVSAGHSQVTIDIYNIKGQKVRSLVNGAYPAGTHSAVWNGTDDDGRSVSSGIYFCRMKSDIHTVTQKMLLMK